MPAIIFIAVAASSPIVPGEAAGSLGVGAVGSSFSRTLTTSGGAAPYTYSVVSGALPAGVTLTSAGVLSGTPTGIGLTGFTIRRTDASLNSVDTAYTLNVTAPLTATEAAGALQTRNVTQPFSQTLGTTGGTAPYTYAVVDGSLPPGVSLSSSGVLSGNPTAVQSSAFSIRRADANDNSVVTAYTMQVNAAYGVGWTGLSECRVVFSTSNHTGSQFVGYDNQAAGRNTSANILSVAFVSGLEQLVIPLTSSLFPGNPKFRVTSIAGVASTPDTDVSGNPIYLIYPYWVRTV